MLASPHAIILIYISPACPLLALILQARLDLLQSTEHDFFSAQRPVMTNSYQHQHYGELPGIKGQTERWGQPESRKETADDQDGENRDVCPLCVFDLRVPGLHSGKGHFDPDFLA